MSNTLGSRATAAGFAVMLLAANVGIGSGKLGMLLGFFGILVGAGFVAVSLGMGDGLTTPIVPAAFLHRNLAEVGLVMASSAVTAAVGGEAGPVLCFTMLVLFLLGLCFVHIHVLQES